MAITSGDAWKLYDGEALTNDTITVSGSGFVGEEGATYEVTGSQTEIGKSNNTFTYTLKDNTKTQNYNIDMVEGTLTVYASEALAADADWDGLEEGGEVFLGGNAFYYERNAYATLQATLNVANDMTTTLKLGGSEGTLGDAEFNRSLTILTEDGTVKAGDFQVNSETTLTIGSADIAAGKLVQEGTIKLDGAAKLVFSDTVTNNGEILLGYNADNALITVSGAFTGTEGTITVNMAGATEDRYLLIDGGEGSDYGTYEIKGGDASGYTLTVEDNDLYAVKGVEPTPGKDYVVNSEWAGYAKGTKITITKDDGKTYEYTFGETAFSNIAEEGGVLSLDKDFKAGKIITLYSDLLDETGDFEINKAYQVNLNGHDYATTGDVYDSITIRNSTDSANTFTGGTLCTADYGYFSVNGINTAVFDTVKNAGGTVYLYTTALLKTNTWVNYDPEAKRYGRGEVYVYCPVEEDIGTEKPVPVLTESFYKMIDQNDTTLTISNYGWVGDTDGITPSTAEKTNSNYLWFYSKNHWEEALPDGYKWATEDGDLVIIKYKGEDKAEKATKQETADEITVDSGEKATTYYSQSIDATKDVEITANENSSELKLTGDVKSSNGDVTITDKGESLHITRDVTSTETTTITTGGGKDSTTVEIGGKVSGDKVVIENTKASGDSTVSAVNGFEATDLEIRNETSETLSASGKLEVTDIKIYNNDETSETKVGTIEITDQIEAAGKIEITNGSVSEETGTINLGTREHTAGTGLTITNKTENTINGGLDSETGDEQAANFKVASGDVTITNDGHLNANVNAANGKVTISNTSANTLIGAYTGASVDVTNTAGAAAKDVTLTATAGNVTITGEAGSSFSGTTTLSATGTITLNGENSFSGTLTANKTIANNGTINLNDSLTLLSSIKLASSAKLNVVISVTGTSGYLSDYSMIGGTKSATTLTIDAQDALDASNDTKSYTIAGNAAAADGQAFTITTWDGGSKTITVNGDSVYDATYGTKYTLAVVSDNLVLSVAKKEVTITAKSASKMYDGTALTAGYTYTELTAGQYVDAKTAGDITHFGTAVNKVKDGYKIKDAGDNDITSYYIVSTADGVLEITKRDVTLTSATDSKVWDDTALTNHTVAETGSGFVAGEGATYDVTGTRTDIGISDNSYSYVLTSATSADDYTITKETGTLTVYPQTVTVNTRVRETMDLTNQNLVMTRRGSVAINTLASEKTDADQIAVEYAYEQPKDPKYIEGEIVLNGDIVVTDRAADGTKGHDTYGVKISSPDLAANLTTNYASRTTVTRDTKSPNGAKVYGISSDGAVNAAGTFKNTITVTATNTAKRDGGALSATGIKAETLTVGDYAATLRVSALDKAAKENSAVEAYGIQTVGSAEFGTISKSIYAYASGDGATAAGVTAGGDLLVTSGDINGAMTVRAVAGGDLDLGADANAVGFKSAGFTNIAGAVAKAVTVTAQNTKDAGSAYASGFRALGNLSAGDIKAAVKATASSAAVAQAAGFSSEKDIALGTVSAALTAKATGKGEATANAIEANGVGSNVTAGGFASTITATAASTDATATAYGIRAGATGTLLVKDGQLGTIKVSATGKDAYAYGIDVGTVATDGGAVLTGTVQATSSNWAGGVMLRGDNTAGVTATLDVLAQGPNAVAMKFGGETLMTLKGSTIEADGTELEVALSGNDAAQTLTLDTTTVTGKVETADGDDTLALTNSTITGNVDLGEDANTLTMKGASNITGDVTTGASDDTIALRGTASIIGNVSTGAGNDRIVVDGSATIGKTDKEYKTTEFNKLDLGDGTNDTVDIFALEGARITADVVNAEMVTFHLTDMNPRTYLWVGNKLGEAEAKTAVTIDVDVSHTDFTEGKERWFTIGRDMNGGILDGIKSITVTGLGFDSDDLLLKEGMASEGNGWRVEIKALDSNGVNTEAGSKTLFAVVTEIDPVHTTVLPALTTINNDVDPLIGTNDGEFYQTEVDLDVSITTLAGDDILAFSGDYSWDVSNDFDMGSGNDTVTTYGYAASAGTYIRKMDPNTVALTGETFASSGELKDFFDAAHVENYIGQFNVTQENGNSLTVVETYDRTKDPIETKALYGTDDAWGTVEYTEFATQDNDLTLTKGAVTDVTGYTSVDFNGETAGEKVSNVALSAAKIDGEGNHVTANDIAGMAMDGFSGKVTNTAPTGQPIITATDATATFADYNNVNSLAFGKLAKTQIVGFGTKGFESVDFNGETAGEKVTGNISEAEVAADAKQSVTVYAATALDGFDGTLTNKDTAKVITAKGATAESETIGKDLFTDATITLTAGTLEGLAANEALKTVTDDNGNSVAVTNAGKIVKAAKNSPLTVTVTDTNAFTIAGDAVAKSGAENGGSVSGNGVAGTFTDGDSLTLTAGTATLTGVADVTLDTGVKVAGTLSSATKGATPAMNSVTAADAALTLTGYTGKVTGGDSKTITATGATGATAEFTDYAHITTLTSGKLEGAFEAVGADTMTAGNLTEVDSDLNLVGSTADDTLNLVGSTYGAIELDAGNDTLNLNADATTGALSNIETLNVNADATTGAIAGATAINVAADKTLTLATGVSALTADKIDADAIAFTDAGATITSGDVTIGSLTNVNKIQGANVAGVDDKLTLTGTLEGGNVPTEPDRLLGSINVSDFEEVVFEGDATGENINWLASAGQTKISFDFIDAVEAQGDTGSFAIGYWFYTRDGDDITINEDYTYNSGYWTEGGKAYSELTTGDTYYYYSAGEPTISWATVA